MSDNYDRSSEVRASHLSDAVRDIVSRPLLSRCQKRKKAEEAISKGDVVLVADSSSDAANVPVTRQGDLKHYSPVCVHLLGEFPVAHVCT